MHFSDFSSYINSLNAEVQIFRLKESFYEPGERWNCIINLESPGTSLKCKGKGDTLESACLSALDQFAIHMGNPSLRAALGTPLLAAPATGDCPF